MSHRTGGTQNTKRVRFGQELSSIQRIMRCIARTLHLESCEQLGSVSNSPGQYLQAVAALIVTPRLRSRPETRHLRCCLASNRTVLHDRRCRRRIPESSLNAFVWLSVTLQGDISHAPICHRSHHYVDHLLTDCFACETCKQRAREMVHHAAEPAVERYDVAACLLRILSQCSPVLIFLCM